MIGDAAFKQLDALDKKIKNKIVRQAQRAAAKILAGEVKSRAPVESGLTKRSVKVKSGKRNKGFIVTNVEISGDPEDPYPGFIEFGTKDHEANPFIRGSVIARRGDVIEAIADAIEKSL